MEVPDTMSSKDDTKYKYLKPAIIVLSLIGLLLSVYLTYLHYTKGQAAFCSQGSDCDFVRNSSYSTMLGIPVALLGAVGYALIFWFAYVSMSRRPRWVLLYIISLAGFAFSAYLTYVELFEIHAVCGYCVASAVIMTAIFILIAMRKSELNPQLSSLSTAVITICVLVVVLIGAYAVQSDSAKKAEEYAGSASGFQIGLARYLNQSGAVMYGSYRCPHCNQQKALFGAAAKYVNYVECDPSGPNANPNLCIARGIMNYPTWVINGSYYQGAKSLSELSELSGYNNSQ